MLEKEARRSDIQARRFGDKGDGGRDMLFNLDAIILVPLLVLNTIPIYSFRASRWMR